jgi:hypothetical protein
MEDKMTKKLFILILAILGAAGIVCGQTLEVSGEMKTGLYWERVDVPGQEVWERAKIHNSDDAGTNEGRFRLNMHLIKDNIGMKVRFQQTAWSSAQPNLWDFAFAYGNFIDEQLRVVIGRLGESPWSAGGPDIWQELDNQLGIRTEVKPTIVPGLNVGFVLNGWNNSNYFQEKNTLVDILKETVFGIAYTNDYFHGRFSYRLDGESDVWNMESEGMEMMYRLEERALKNLVEGLSIWANGWWKGIGSNDRDIVSYQNWLYAQLAPPEFIAQLRLGFHTGIQRQELHTRLSFYYNVLPWLSAGLAGNFRVDFGDSKIKDVPYKLWNIEPQIRANFGPNAYIALVYSFENEPLAPDKDKTTQKLNLRTVYTF